MCPPNTTTPYIRPGLGHYVEPDEEDLNLEQIRVMVSKTKGYYVRDYSLGLGWNNASPAMRYILEGGVLHATLLNRTLVFPSFVYARACQWNVTVCGSYATMVNRGDAIGSSEWRELPIDQQMGWRVPIGVMVDFKHLRSRYNVITIREYLLLHGLDPELERSNGAWARDAYHTSDPKPSLAVIRNHEYDPSSIVRVDRLPPVAKEVGGSVVATVLQEALGQNHLMNLDDARKTLQNKGMNTWSSEEEFHELLDSNGFAILHTFAGAVTEPIQEIAQRSSLRGLVDDYDHYTEEVLLLEGEVHLYRKPGFLLFTTVEERIRFTDLVLHGFRPIPQIVHVAERIATRMLAVNDGRMWMTSHMRRGDFVRFSWAMSNDLHAHLDRIKQRLGVGAQKIRDMVKSRERWKTADVPNVSADQTFIDVEPPRDGDKFYLATDERTPDGLQYIREHGGVLAMDILTPEDRRLVGWPLLLTDVLAILEQVVMSHGAYFYAHAMSSVAGGVVNMRGARGMDPRLTLID
ncbi:hypothetical protein BS47DRAFT_1468488 [Hydnum rufescens UP504]|uniref:Uncharacterized protein n=1 Tax=Hydnum rufescens UP504 TaxID=1448309 RepID=A0A9P6DUJ1_9AGAM|nr:hypothetical protein BS47DRAFT_1468488 [Hydnum rufescens UP504]